MKKLTNFNLFTMVYGSTIGSGIFLLIGVAIGGAGHSLPLAVLVGGAYVIFSMLFAYVISSFVPLDGGIYSQLNFIGMPVFTGAMALSNLLNATMISGFATGIMDYMAALIPGIAPYSKVLAVVLILLFFAVNTKSMGSSAKVQNIMTVVLITSLLTFGIYGLTKVDFGGFRSDPNFFLGGGSGFINAAALMGFACAGGEATGFNLARDIKDPTRNVPKVTLLAVLAAVVTYLLMSIVAAGVLPVEQVMYQPLSVVADAIFPKPLYLFFVIGGAVFALLTSLNGLMAGIRYPLEAAANDGWLPALFKKKTEKGYPTAIMIMVLVLALIPTIFGISFDTLATMAALSTLPLYIYANIVCIKLPKQYPNLWKKSMFHMPYPLYVCMMLLATGAAIFYAYSYVADYETSFLLTAVAVIAVLYAVCFVRVKTGGVDIVAMQANKERIAAEIAAANKSVEA